MAASRFTSLALDIERDSTYVSLGGEIVNASPVLVQREFGKVSEQAQKSSCELSDSGLWML